MVTVRGRSRALLFFILIVVSVTVRFEASVSSSNSVLPLVEPNDNRRTGGALDRDTLTIDLRAAMGRWQPEGQAGPTVEVEALGEVGKALTVPAPLIRVVQGTAIVASIRNDLTSPLMMHGFCTRGGAACEALLVPPGETRAVRFESGPAGTYHYWASTLGAPVPFRELAGAFIVDPQGNAPTGDRVIVITEWSDLTAAQLREIMTADSPTEVFVGLKPRVTFVMNGLSWPATERFAYDVGERVTWRILNLSSQPHPLHLHGSYFDVNSQGNGLRETAFADGQRPRVVTQLVPPGGTMSMTWTPERAGNWLFHCHVMHHVALSRRIEPDVHAQHGGNQHGHSAHGGVSAGMAGMVIGVTVRDPAPITAPFPEQRSPRRLTLVMRGASVDRDGVSKSGFVLQEDGVPHSDTPTAPGPPLVLRRDEPVEITLVNHLPDATAIHWHGIELESYYDGVHGFSGAGRRVTPMIAPGEQFVVRFTPPRAGTFIYHTHLHDYRQLSSGLYGPLIVTDANESFEPSTDHVVVLGREGLTSEEPSVLTEPESVVINGVRAARFVWKAGVRHRVRLINITPDDIFNVSLQTADGPVKWKPVAKDGVALPVARSTPVAARQTIAVGETYDFEYDAPAGRGTAWLEVRTPGGKWQAQAQVIYR